MNTVDFQVLNNALGWLTQGKAVALVTIVRTWGSAPRPLGSLFAVSMEGDFAGSVSGGCIEDDLIRRFSAQFPEKIEVILYGLSAEEGRHFQLPCGGTLELLVERLNDLEMLRQLIHAISTRQLVKRRLNVQSGKSQVCIASKDTPLSFHDGELRQVFGPSWRLLMIGAGQVSEYLAQMAPTLNFAIFLNDPRIEQRQNWQGGEVCWLDGMPDDAVLAFLPDQRTVIVTLSHDPKIDDMALMEALKTNAFYVGAIGSHASAAKRRERLLTLDVSAAELAHLHAPIGLPIHSHTPAEIAISILAELVMCRNQQLAKPPPSSCSLGSVDVSFAAAFGPVLGLNKEKMATWYEYHERFLTPCSPKNGLNPKG
jgi:xanthine dehydrogenase accessory factor